MKEIRKQQLILMMKHPIPKSKVGIVHLKVVREETALYGTGRFQNASEAARMVRPLLEYSDREQMICLALDQTHTPIALEIVAVGSLNVCGVDIRDIFKHALLSNAASIICFHNHPSGHMEASPEDIRITSRIKAAGELLGIRLLDHILIGQNGDYLSFKESGIFSFINRKEAV